MTDVAAPLHVQAERVLRRLVADASPGDLLPSEVELARRLEVSRITVRQAMQRLVAAGLVRRTPGRGTEVIDRHIATQLDFTPFVRALEAGGHRVRTASAHISVGSVGDEAAEALGLSGGTEVREIHRVRLVDEVPFAYLRTVLAPRVPAPEDLTGSLYEFLENTGVHLARLDDVVAAAGASEEVSAALDIQPGTPVLSIRRVAYDDYGQPVEFTRTYLRSGAGYSVEHKR